MLERLHKARLVWPTLAALGALAVLVGLGTWQLERKRWKEGLIANIETRVKARPIELIPHQASKETQAELERRVPEYTHVAVRGRFHHDKERFLYAPTPAGPGWHVYTPLVTEQGTVIWVNRGFVPDVRKAPATRTKGQVDGEVEVRGLARYPAPPGLFAPQNDGTRNIWYWPDLAAMTAAAFPADRPDARAGSPAPRLLPLIIEADAQPAPPGGLPKGGVTRVELPNRHLEYALTWYGLAATLVGVYLAFAINRFRAAA